MPDPARVAVIAVHGVGDHQPFETVTLIGDLLGSLRDSPGSTPRYIPFTETKQRVSVRPVKVATAAKKKYDAPKTWGPMDAMLKTAQAGPSESVMIDPAADVGHNFLEGQLAEFTQDKPEDTYEMLRLEGKRLTREVRRPKGDVPKQVKEEMLSPENEHKSEAKPTEQLVHIYEMYWADLSRLGTGFTQIFGELYQVMFHLASVGVNNVKAAALHFQNTPAQKAWRNFDRSQSFPAALLAWPIPILNLFLLAFVPGILAVSLMRTKLWPAQEFMVLDALAAILLIVGTGYGLMIYARLQFAVFSLPALAFALAAAALGYWSVQHEKALSPAVIESIAAVLIAVLCFAVVWRVIQAYEQQRPGSERAALWLLAAMLGCLMTVLSLGKMTGLSSTYPALGLSFNAIEITFELLRISWVLFAVGMAWNLYGGWKAVRSSNPNRHSDLGPDAAMHYDRAVRTRWTARLLIALPSVAFIVITLVSWTGIVKLVRPFLPGEDIVLAKNKPCPAPTVGCPGQAFDPMCYTPIMRGDGGEQLGGEWIVALMNKAGVSVLPVLLVAIFLAMLIAAWSMFPAVWDEVSPPLGKDGEDLARQSRALGTWLSFGFRYMHFAGAILYVGMFCYYFSPYVNPDKSGRLVDVIGVLVAGAAVGIFGFGGRLSKLALGFRPAVRVMLDVDSWMREHPRKSNPTGRICARYVSVLRHILAWKDDKGPYDAIVIVAHSQGTVITSDLLRFLRRETLEAEGGAYDPELVDLFHKMPVYLFTMGSPLRQLYGLRFPYLYAYARGKENSHVGDHALPDLDPQLTPDPSELGVQAWYNAFRSGDYIGRNLWRTDKCAYLWEPSIQASDDHWDPPVGKPKHVSMDEKGTRVEFCIGPGAHTHYWDSTAGPIAEMLDLLIKDCEKRPVEEPRV